MEFTKTEFKIINENNTRTTDILNNLEPDTTYIIGVLVITDDGNFNDKDIVYDQYKTSCIRKYFGSTIETKIIFKKFKKTK